MSSPDIAAKKLADLKQLVGTEYKPYKVEIEKGMIRRLAEAIGDTNPLWRDEDKAKKSKYGGIVAPPALYISIMMNGYQPGISKQPEMKRGFDAWHKLKIHAPIRPGDIINVTSKIVDVYEQRGKKLDRMFFFVYETILTNQRGEKVCTHLGSMLIY